MNTTAIKIKEQIEDFCGIVDGKIDGIYVSFEVKEMFEKVPSSVYRTRPSGRFQINVRPAEYRRRSRDTIFRTKKGTNAFNILDVKEAIMAQIKVKKIIQSSEDNRMSNEAVAAELRDKFKFKTKYISSYAPASTDSFVAPSVVEGKVAVQIHFGQVTPEVAERILAFVQTLESV